MVRRITKKRTASRSEVASERDPVRLTVSLDAATHVRLTDYVRAAKPRTTVTAVIEYAIERFLESTTPKRHS
jgi:hypothetical protein